MAVNGSPLEPVPLSAEAVLAEAEATEAAATTPPPAPADGAIVTVELALIVNVLCRNCVVVRLATDAVADRRAAGVNLGSIAVHGRLTGNRADRLGRGARDRDSSIRAGTAAVRRDIRRGGQRIGRAGQLQCATGLDRDRRALDACTSIDPQRAAVDVGRTGVGVRRGQFQRAAARQCDSLARTRNTR